MLLYGTDSFLSHWHIIAHAHVTRHTHWHTRHPRSHSTQSVVLVSYWIQTGTTSVVPFLTVLSFPLLSNNCSTCHHTRTLSSHINSEPPRHRTSLPLALKHPPRLPRHPNPNPISPCQPKLGICPPHRQLYSPRLKVIGSRTRRITMYGQFKCEMLSSLAK